MLDNFRDINVAADSIRVYHSRLIGRAAVCDVAD